MGRPLAGSCTEKKCYCIRHGSDYSTFSLLAAISPKPSALLPRLTLVASKAVLTLRTSAVEVFSHEWKYLTEQPPAKHRLEDSQRQGRYDLHVRALVSVLP